MDYEDEKTEIIETNQECIYCGSYVDNVGDELCSRCKLTDGEA